MPISPYYKGGDDVGVVDGGTGASSASGARTNLSALDSTAHSMLDHTGLTGVGDLTTAAHASLDHSTFPMSYRNVGTATSAVASGDLAAGDGTNLFFWDASAGTATLSGSGNLGVYASSAVLNLAASGSNYIAFHTNSTERWRVDASGHLVAVADNSYDVGATASARPRNVYAGTDVYVGTRKLGVAGTSMQLAGAISVLTDLGSDLVARSGTLVTFQARRGSAGSAGTTTIELEINGSATGDTLSWANTDANFTLKSTTISQAVTLGDRISFRVTAAETGASDIFAMVF